jgi:cold shock protein
MPDGGGGDVFVHFSEIQQRGRRSLEIGERVRFEMGERDGRPHGLHVERLGVPDSGDGGPKQPL